VTATVAGKQGILARFKLSYGDFCLDVDLRLPSRGVTAVFGPSGCGKTSLLRCIAGLERTKVGQLEIDGEVWQDSSTWFPVHRRPLGFVFQEASLFGHLTVQGNLDYGRRRSNSSVDMDHIIALLGIEHLLQRRPGHLSGGEKQRVSMARALATQPRLMLMDEPLASLDHQRKQEILPYLERLHLDLAIPVLYVTHAPDEVARLADHVLVLRDGKVQMQGSLQETLSRLDLPALLGQNRRSVIEGRLALLDARWGLVRVDFAGGSLWTKDQGMAVGTAVRVDIQASDVSLALHKSESSSIQNLLPGTVDALAEDEHPSQVLVRVRVGESLLLASVTRRAVADLQILPGMPVWTQIKSVALLG